MKSDSDTSSTLSTDHTVVHTDFVTLRTVMAAASNM